jgi:hypothetical protein
MEEAAMSRLYGAIHFRSDIEVGKSQGRRVGSYTVKFAQNDGADGPRTVTGNAVQTLDAASFRSPIAPGSLATVFKANLTPHIMTAAEAPLPTTLDGVSMVFNDTLRAPIFATGQTR